MENKDNLICIFDNTGNDFNQIFLDMYATFITKELRDGLFIV